MQSLTYAITQKEMASQLLAHQREDGVTVVRTDIGNHTYTLFLHVAAVLFHQVHNAGYHGGKRSHTCANS